MTHESAKPNDLNPSPTTRSKVLVWAVLSSLLLVASGFGRLAQSSYYEEESSYEVVCPFPLSQIPRELDGWRMIEGSAATLDPLTTRITGSVDHILGTYFNEDTGVKLSVMLLYGPAEPVLPHTPEICYPSSGFVSSGPLFDQDIKINDSLSARFRIGSYVKFNGRNTIQETAYYSFRHDGVWIPWVSTQNSPRKNPGIFKLQISRRMAAGESRSMDDPIEEFLKKLMPVLEAKIHDSMTPPVAAKPS